MEEEQLTKKEQRKMRREEKRRNQDQARTARTAKSIGVWVLVAVIIGGAIYGLVQLVGNAPANPNGGENILTLSEPIGEDDWIKGNPDAKVTLVEYSDFQCPACASYFPVLKQLSENFGEDIRFVYRHFPISRIHPQAELAARASEAAGRQGKFWEMHDLIFENQNTWANRGGTKTTFISYADSLGLNIEQFEEDIDSKDIQNKVEKQFDSGVASGVSGTPTFFLNDKQISSPPSYEAFSTIIQGAIDATE